MSITHALKWSFLAELASKAIQPVVFIALARLLTPEDFGVMSAAIMVIAFSQIFWEAGMGKALIQRQREVDAAANVAFWINITLGFIFAILLFFAAAPVAHTVFRDERVTAVIQCMTLQVFLGAVSSVQTALLQKQLDFKQIFWVRLATVSLPALASVPLAWSGMGYWALVAGALVGQAAQVVMLWHVSAWRPSFQFNRKLALEMGRFGGWVGASGLLAWFYVWADSLVVGVFLNSHDLGLYRMGNQFTTLIFVAMFSPILPVLYSHLSSMRGDNGYLRSFAISSMKLVSIISISVGFILWYWAAEIESTVFRDRWHGLSHVIGYFGLIHGFAWIVGMNGEYFRSAGKPKYETIAMLGVLPVYLSVYIIFVQNGLQTFMQARLGVVFAGMALQLYLLRRLLNIKLINLALFIAKAAVVSGLTLFCVRRYLVIGFESELLGLASNVLTGLFVCSFVWFLLERRGLLTVARNLLPKLWPPRASEKW